MIENEVQNWKSSHRWDRRVVLKIEEVYPGQGQLHTHKLTQSVSAMNPADLSDTADYVSLIYLI